MLTDWGMREPLDPDLEYPACVMLIGTHVIKAMLNDCPGGQKPYSISLSRKHGRSSLPGGSVTEPYEQDENRKGLHGMGLEEDERVRLKFM